MAEKISVEKLAEDFIWGERRVADTTNVKFTVQCEGELDELPQKDSLTPGLLPNGLRINKDGYGYVQIAANRSLTPKELVHLELLAALAIYFRARSAARLNIVHHLGPILKEIRQSLKMSQQDVADNVQTSRIAVSRWESGAQAPGTGAAYRWCEALGIVSPGKSHVRVINITPELLRFLREDAERLRLLTPEQFENFVGERLERMGYYVEPTGGIETPDGGVDLIAIPKAANVGSILMAVQVKHHRGQQKTGVDAVDRLLGWRNSDFGVGLLVTNTGFTADALWKAKKDSNDRFLRLRDFFDLKRWLEDCFDGDKDWREIPQFVELTSGLIIPIPRPSHRRIFMP